MSRGGESQDLGFLQGEHLSHINHYQSYVDKETCGMERFLVSPVEEVDRGVEIGDEVLVIDRNHPLQTPLNNIFIIALAGGFEANGRPMVV